MTSSDLDSPTWLSQAWADWIRPLGLLVLAGLAYLGYRFDLIGEQVAGIALVIALLLGVLGVGVVPAWGLARRSADRIMILLLASFALIGAAGPSLHVAWAPGALASARLTSAALKVGLTTNTSGPYELVVSSRFKQGGAAEAEASYVLELDGAGKEQIRGEVKRTLHRYRTSRRGGSGTSLEEHTETVHRLSAVSGGVVEVSTAAISDQLDGIDVALRPAGPRPELFWVLGALAVLLGLALDARLVVPISEEDRKVRGPKRELSHLTSVSAMLLVFAINFPMEATPRTLVKATVGAFFLALLLGGAGGWLLASFVRVATQGKRRA